MPLFLLDANVLIDAGRDYYPLEMVPEFWDWLVHHGSAGSIKLPLEIYEEVCDGNDPLAEWLRDRSVRDAIVMADEVDVELVARAVSDGYASDLTDDEVLKIGRDPFLVAYALVAPQSRYVVTTEGSKPARRRANRHLPDVCGMFGISVCNTFELTRRLGFRTSWRRPAE